MKRFARVLIAAAGLATISVPAIFAKDFHDNGANYDRRDKVVVVRKDSHNRDRRDNLRRDVRYNSRFDRYQSRNCR